MFLYYNYTAEFFNLTTPENEKFLQETLEVIEILLFLTGITTMITMVILFTKLFDQYNLSQEKKKLEQIQENARKENEERKARGETPVEVCDGYDHSHVNEGKSGLFDSTKFYDAETGKCHCSIENSVLHVLPASLHRPREELMQICITGGAAVPKAALNSTEFVIRNEKLRRVCRIKRLRAGMGANAYNKCLIFQKLSYFRSFS